MPAGSRRRPMCLRRRRVFSGGSAAPATVRPQVQAEPQTFYVYFDFNHARLTPEATRTVDQAIDQAKRLGTARIEITGNTDTVGSKGYNLVLSDQRARAVRNYMVAHGVTEDQIAIRAYGKEHLPVATADNVRERQNRRVEIVVSGAGGAPSVRNGPGAAGAPMALGRGAIVTPVD